MTFAHSPGQRGFSLVESLIAFAVASIGMTALLCGESDLRLQSELTRQRAEAVRLAQQEIEQVRAFGTFDTLLAMPTVQAAVVKVGPTHFTVERRLAPAALPSAWTIGIDVQWQDRRGQPAGIALQTQLAALDPALSGLSLAQRFPATAQAPWARAVSIPLAAADLGDGRSRFTPAGAAGIGWVFDNAGGQVTSVCAADGASAGRCTATNGLTVSGHVRFASGATDDGEVARHPTSAALDLDLQLRTAQGRASCFDDARAGSGQTDVTFHCLVELQPDQRRWSGRLDILPIGWSTGHDAQSFRVCRYSSASDSARGLPNAEHPLDYHDVDTPLAHQNFLVVRGDRPCPAGDGRDGLVHATTFEQAPQPQTGPPA